MLRFEDEATLSDARAFFENAQKHCRRVEIKVWRQSRKFWHRWRDGWAHFVLARIDSFVALRQFDGIKR